MDAHTVKLVKSGSELTAERILIATGGRPYLPEGLPGLELGISSNEAFHLPELPRRVLIVGGGYIALEFANIFSGLGSEVRVVHRGDRVLRGFDDDLRSHMHIEAERAGIRLTMKATLTKIEKSGDARRVTLSTGEKVEADVVMFAIGRDPNTAGLGLERAGVKLDADGAVVVDEFSQSSVPSIYAIGDVTNRMNLTPIAIRDGHAFADTVYNNRPTPVDHSSVPSAVFSRPPIGTVGLAEGDARRSHAPWTSTAPASGPMRTAFVGNEQRTLMKLVVDAQTDQLLGVHVAGVGCAGDDPARRGRREGRPHQTAVGQHGRAASDRRRGAGADAREDRGRRAARPSGRRSDARSVHRRGRDPRVPPRFVQRFPRI